VLITQSVLAAAGRARQFADYPSGNAPGQENLAGAVPQQIENFPRAAVIEAEKMGLKVSAF
jgi:hypothetical protein